MHRASAWLMAFSETAKPDRNAAMSVLYVKSTLKYVSTIFVFIYLTLVLDIGIGPTVRQRRRCSIAIHMCIETVSYGCGGGLLLNPLRRVLSLRFVHRLALLPYIG